MARAFAIAVCLLALAGCQGPSPYWVMTPDRGEAADLLYLRDRAGVVVLPIDGLDPARGAALTEALIDALQRANVPAGTGDGAGNGNSYFLSAVATAGESENGQVPVAMTWDLLDRNGRPVGAGESVLAVRAALWIAPGAKDLASAGDRLAVPVAALVQSEAEEDLAAGPAPSIVVAGLAEAPGNGGETVPRLIAHLLEREGFAISGGSGPAIGVAGTYRASPADNGGERVAIQWRLTAPDGREIGLIDQENVVPRGSLDGDWGEAAYYIAAGAVEGILGLLAGGG